jgi:hypothetical protein
MTPEKRRAVFLPFLPLEMKNESEKINIRLTGLSADTVRTTVYYRIDDNPDDYQIQNAFLIDNQDRSYPLIAVERKINGESLCLMEFSPLLTETESIELCITSLRQAPIEGSFRIKGTSLVDPWSPEICMTSVNMKKLNSWSNSRDDKSPGKSWYLKGNWSFSIPLSNWSEEAYKIEKPLNFSLALGKEKVYFREFCSSGNSAFIVFEAKDEALQQLGETYHSAVMERFANSDNICDFEKNLTDIGIRWSYIPVKLNLRIRDPEKMILYTPDFVEPWGVIPNRWYYFFDHPISSGKLELLLQEINDLYLTTPIEIPLVSLVNQAEEMTDPCSMNFDAGAFYVKGEFYMDRVVFTKENIGIIYNINLHRRLKSITLKDSFIRIKTGKGEVIEIPTLGGHLRLDPSGEKLEKSILFPRMSIIEENYPENLTLVIKSVDVKFSQPLTLPFTAVENQDSCLQEAM